jgi:hypothetical protein
MQAMACPYEDGWFVCSAPTFAQAKQIFWKDLKALIPKRHQASISETGLTIRLRTGVEISVRGLDKPERIEGRTLDGIVIDELGNCKADAWDAHIRPALATQGREGWAWLIGVPEGRNHYWRMAQRAEADETGEWGVYTWWSETVLSPGEIAAARASMDPLTYEQEMHGSFVTFEGRAYYPFLREDHCVRGLCKTIYDPRAPLIFALDFNVDPGVAAVCQETSRGAIAGLPPTAEDPRWDQLLTGVIGEVYIPRNSNTPAVCRKLAKDWGKHEGRVEIYGDATGGARGSAKVQGTDWDLVQQVLRPVFGSRVHMRVPRANPRERVRLNAMNSRLCSCDGVIHMVVDPQRAKHVVEDLEGVTLLKGGGGEIDKKDDPTLTHMSDGLGYYIQKRFPVGEGNNLSIIQL